MLRLRPAVTGAGDRSPCKRRHAETYEKRVRCFKKENTNVADVSSIGATSRPRHVRRHHDVPARRIPADLCAGGVLAGDMDCSQRVWLVWWLPLALGY